MPRKVGWYAVRLKVGQARAPEAMNRLQRRHLLAVVRRVRSIGEPRVHELGGGRHRGEPLGHVLVELRAVDALTLEHVHIREEGGLARESEVHHRVIDGARRPHAARHDHLAECREGWTQRLDGGRIGAGEEDGTGTLPRLGGRAAVGSVHVRSHAELGRRQHGCNQAPVVRIARGEVDHGSAAKLIPDLIDDVERCRRVGEHQQHRRALVRERRYTPARRTGNAALASHAHVLRCNSVRLGDRAVPDGNVMAALA